MTNTKTTPKSNARIAAELYVKSKGEIPLFKRDKKTGRTMAETDPGYKERPYYFTCSYEGKRNLVNTKLNVETKAQDQAFLLYVSIVEGYMTGQQEKIDCTKTRAVCTATIKDLFAALRTVPIEADKASRDRYADSLCQF